MSGRKKNRKHHRGQPSHELLNELNSLRELLGSDMEADIPLLDQVATPSPGSSDQPSASASSHPSPSQRAPLAPPRPLQEADLPILFSPVDEEPIEEMTSQLSDADLELLRPLQNLPRKPGTPAPQIETVSPESPAAEVRIEADREPIELNAQRQEPREEFQPSLFEGPQGEEPSVQEIVQQQAPLKQSSKEDSKEQRPKDRVIEPQISAAPRETSKGAPDAPVTEEPAKEAPIKKASQYKVPVMTENPFLPPHIRARLTGGRIPRPEVEPAAPSPEPAAIAQEPAAAPEEEQEQKQPTPSERERLIKQLVGEQMAELEQQLRANITALVDEIYPLEAPE
ncbi:hypothetical protein [Microbulbifer sp. ALW1]|uniref:hypothetical protein n=1 Tax=Microbulbifer sp. (strain ALW1) TaxID=1516059 RepID=UPI001357208E|nr:hypothetical protein [Microbulbifer sp. ALW1]